MDELITAGPPMLPRPSTRRVRVSRRAEEPEEPPEEPTLPSMLFFLWHTEDLTVTATKTGTGDSLTKSTSQALLTDAAAGLSAEVLGQLVTVTGAGNANNNGTYPINVYTSPTQMQWLNAACVTEGSFPGTWRTQGKATQWIDQEHGRIFANPSTAALSVRELNGKQYPCTPGVALNPHNTRLTWDDIATIGTALNGHTDISIAARLRVDTYSSVINIVAFADNTGGTSPTNTLTLQMSSASIAMLRSQSGQANMFAQFTGWTPPNGVMRTLAGRYTASTRIAQFFMDGVYIGESPVQAAARSVANLRYAHIGGYSSFIGAQSANYFAGACAGPAAWTDAQMLAVHEEFLAREAA